MTTIAENFDRISALLRRAETEFARPAGSVKLLAVSKRHSSDSIREAAAWGQRDFGENYLQEAEEKIGELAELDLCWHFIGPIQSNKTRRIAELFRWVHSVDRTKTARRLSEQRPASLPGLNVCVQVNLSDETSKSGVSLAEAETLCQEVDSLPNLVLRGLMAIPAPLVDFSRQRTVFAELAAEYRRLHTIYPSIDTLSMGMSEDYGAAIAEGSTLVRLGTALFGARPG